MAYIHVFTWVLVPLSIDNFALQLYDLGSEKFSVAPVIHFSFPYILHLFILIYLCIIFIAFNYYCFGFFIIRCVCSHIKFVHFCFAMYFIYLFQTQNYHIFTIYVLFAYVLINLIFYWHGY